MSTKATICHVSLSACLSGVMLLSASLTPLRAGEGESGIIVPEQYASLPANGGPSDPDATGSLPKTGALSNFPSLVSQGAITLRDGAPTGCIPSALRDVVASIASRFGPLSIESTHRSRGHNWRAGGARHSLHLACRAIDFRVRARARGVMAYLRSLPEVGGLKVYRNGIIHIDDGSRRSW
jgi:hypothetical protein